MTLVLGVATPGGVTFVSDGIAFNQEGATISDKMFKSFLLDNRIIVGFSTNGLTIDSINQFLSSVGGICKERDELVYPDIVDSVSSLANLMFPHSDHLILIGGCSSDGTPHLYKLKGSDSYKLEVVDTGIVGAIGYTKGHDFTIRPTTDVYEARDELTELMKDVMQSDKRVGGQLQTTIVTTSGETLNQIYVNIKAY